MDCTTDWVVGFDLDGSMTPEAYGAIDTLYVYSCASIDTMTAPVRA